MAKSETGKLREPGRKLRRGILKLLGDEALGNNGRLPHLQALAVRFGVSYTSVSRIIGQLKREGRVAVFPGKGVFAVQGSVSTAGTPHHIRLGPDLGALLSRADIQSLRRQCPDAAIEIASGIPDRDADLGLVDAVSVLIRTHRKSLTTASKLGFDRAYAERLGVDPLHLAQLTLNGELAGLPIAVNPLLAGIRANLRGDEPARIGPDGRVTLDSFADYAIRHTRDSGQEARRMSGFDFYNHTLHTHALTRAAGGDWYSLEAFYGETTLRALRRLWELIHHNRTCLMLVSSATPVTRLDVWKMDRVALLFANYHEISALLHKPRAFGAAKREIFSWGGEPSRYTCLCAKPIVRPELYRAAAELLTSHRLQLRILKRGQGLPTTLSPVVWQKASHLLGRQCGVLRDILKTTYNPYRVDGSPEAFWQAEYTVRDYLADLYQIGAKDADSVARRRENTQQANREAQAAVAPLHSRKGN